MASIIPGQFCADCADNDEQVPAAHEWDARFMDSGGLFLCDRCADRRQEASCEPDYDAVGIVEQCAAALKQKREGR